MIDAATILTGGGLAALIYALGYAYRQWRASRREDEAAPHVAATSAVTDAATANSLLLASLREEREEVARLSGRIGDLETQNALLYERLREQRREYEREIVGLRNQINGLSRQLDALQQKLRGDPPEPS